ncbi:hypothetical protein [Desulfitobacterium chlororespirans]|uniref:Uncharacterized protein n=1 Tax=Desulfitobacterium chlororespirans DSM 11544 TaxID=1121395 RepID=A0A1M7U387_9FIRM|nr:hypothetical protein [Desulfitobacterium chlororespirans]SHN77406.1 hypothetical protein SAMN02745215_02881 [Desulfitobacterium chlororespirans DSM 11544]
MGKIGIKCGFCGEPLYMDSYKSWQKGRAGSIIVFCDNDECPVKPCSDAVNPSRALAEAKAFGNLVKEFMD